MFELTLSRTCRVSHSLLLLFTLLPSHSLLSLSPVPGRDSVLLLPSPSLDHSPRTRCHKTWRANPHALAARTTRRLPLISAKAPKKLPRQIVSDASTSSRRETTIGAGPRQLLPRQQRTISCHLLHRHVSPGRRSRETDSLPFTGPSRAQSQPGRAARNGGTRAELRVPRGRSRRARPICARAARRPSSARSSRCLSRRTWCLFRWRHPLP